MRILLTGFSGTLGPAVARELIGNGHKLRVLLHGTAIDARNFDFDGEIIWGSLLHRHLFDQITKDTDIVVHCAWENRGAFDGMLEKANLDGTMHLVESAEQNKVKTFIHISSVGVYGLTRLLWGKVLDEDYPLVSKEESLNPYPWVKVLIEEKCEELRGKLDMNLMIIRPGLLFSDVKAPAKKLITLRGKQYGLLVGTGKNHLPYMHVDDVAEMISMIINKSPQNGVFNCVPTTCLPAAEFLKRWGKFHGHRIRVLKLPPFVLRIMTWLIQKLKNIMGRDSTGSSVDYQILTGVRDIRYSAEKAVETLGWQDGQTKLICE
ncbi:MAG: NAD-dependent epimerase/dehydratase family protein [Planctomycetota bacterium]|jgi:nucleoside-diphosphate-sugar epimerase